METSNPGLDIRVLDSNLCSNGWTRTYRSIGYVSWSQRGERFQAGLNSDHRTVRFIVRVSTTGTTTYLDASVLPDVSCSLASVSS